MEMCEGSSQHVIQNFPWVYVNSDMDSCSVCWRGKNCEIVWGAKERDLFALDLFTGGLEL